MCTHNPRHVINTELNILNDTFTIIKAYKNDKIETKQINCY